MHILISALHRPTKPTGVCRHAANLARALADTDRVTRVTVLLGAWQHEYFTTVFDLSTDKIDVISIDIHNSSIARNIWFLSGLPELTARLRPDLVHLAFPLPFGRSRFACPVVATIHDLYPYEYPENFGRVQAFFNRRLLQQCIGQSDGLTCVSQTTLARFNFFFPTLSASKKLTAIYNIIDFDKIEPLPPALFARSPNSPFLLNVAQHRKNKNLDLLIDAYANLLTTHQIDPAIDLVIVGSQGPETANLTRQIHTLNLATKVHLLAAIDDRQLCWLYQQCLAFIIPSAIEGFCLPFAEAIHLACKVVCTDLPIFREIGSSSCIYFDLQTEPLQHLTAAIVRVIEQPSPVLDRQSSQFDRQVIADLYLQFYLAILNQH